MLTYFSTDVDDIGDSTVTVRHCDAQNRLYEVNWKIEVLQNSGPQFLTALQTSFVVNIDETLTYDMPRVEDLENNADSEIVIEPFTGYSDFYPQFMNTYFDNLTLQNKIGLP